jgi:hypothetical protein
VWELKKGEEIEDWLRIVRDAGVYIETKQLILTHKKITKMVSLPHIETMIANEPSGGDFII